MRPNHGVGGVFTGKNISTPTGHHAQREDERGRGFRAPRTDQGRLREDTTRLHRRGRHQAVLLARQQPSARGADVVSTAPACPA